MGRERRENAFSGRGSLAGLVLLWVQISNNILATATYRDKMHPGKKKQHWNAWLWINEELPMPLYSLPPVPFVTSSLVGCTHRSLNTQMLTNAPTDSFAGNFRFLNHWHTGPVYSPLKRCPRGQIYRRKDRATKNFLTRYFHPYFFQIVIWTLNLYIFRTAVISIYQLTVLMYYTCIYL